ncbi:MAG TPA: efflux RND transporter periplasmic adaptor subunit, partial [Pedobacter sp.]
GMYVTALISIGEQLTPAVPVDAVIRSEGREYIFIVLKETAKTIQFKKEEIRTGVSEMGYIQIKTLTKLPGDVQFVRKGAFYLESKSAGGSDEDD